MKYQNSAGLQHLANSYRSITTNETCKHEVKIESIPFIFFLFSTPVLLIYDLEICFE